MSVTVQDVRDAIRRLDLSGRPLCVHSSLKSFGKVDGGPQTIIEGILAEGCTLMAPTFSLVFAVPPPPGEQAARNAYDYASPPAYGTERIFAPSSNDVDAIMGAIPAAVLRTERRTRGNHPLSSFTAIGPIADRLIIRQTPFDFLAPLEALAEDRGFVVMMGVGLTCMTLLHLAELRAGRNCFIRWANGPDGRPMRVQIGGCSNGFDSFDPVLSPLERQTVVGKSVWRVFQAKDTLEAAERAIRENPTITRCGDLNCPRCDDAIRGGPILGA